MRKLSRGAYEDTKGLVRAAETLLEVVVMTLLYYGAFRMGYEIEHFVYKGKYVRGRYFAPSAIRRNSACSGSSTGSI